MFPKRDQNQQKQIFNFKFSERLSDLLSLGFKSLRILIVLGLMTKFGMILNSEMDFHTQKRLDQKKQYLHAKRTYLSSTREEEEALKENPNDRLGNASRVIQLGKDGYLLVKEIVSDVQESKQQKNLESFEEIMGEKIHLKDYTIS